MTDAPLPIDKRTGEALSPVQRRRVSKKVRKALTERVKQGRTWEHCAEAAGLSQSGLYKALKQPHVAALLEKIKGEYIQQCETLEGVHKARALEVARELLDNSKSEQVKARMVEFLRGEAKPAAAINLNLQQNFGSGGYEFIPPGARVVDITPPEAEDSKSPADDGQDTDT